MCVICLIPNTSNTSTDNLKCKECPSNICYDCLDSYMDFCCTNKLLPKCPECPNYFLYSQIKNYESDYHYAFRDEDKNEENEDIKNVMPKILSKKYVECCYNFLNKDKALLVNDKITYETMFKNLKNERTTFIKNNFPKAIDKIINICLKSKLNHISSNNKKIFEEKINNENKYCMISNCNGKLEKKEYKTDSESKAEFMCLKCDNKFCLKCERLILINHVCKQEDIESINFINKLVKCPKCNLPVQKSEGCNNMTCAICNINFDYITGNIVEEGNHNVNVIVKLYNHKLSYVYKDLYNKTIIDWLLEIEKLEPKIETFDYIVKVLIKIKNLENENINANANPNANSGNGSGINTTVLKKKITQSFEKFIVSKNKYRKFINTITQIEKLHEENILTLHSLKNIYLGLVKEFNLEKSPESNVDADVVDANVDLSTRRFIMKTNLLYYVFSLLNKENSNEIKFPEHIKIENIGLINNKQFAINRNLLTSENYKIIVNKEPYKSIINWLNQVNIYFIPEQFSSIKCSEKYILSVDPIKEKQFLEQKKIHGTFYAFHGTNPKNWHSILIDGLKIFSHTSRMVNGAAHGAGIYCSNSSTVSIAYSSMSMSFQQNKQYEQNEQNEPIIALCEIINDPKLLKRVKVRMITNEMSEIIVVKDEDILITRYLFSGNFNEYADKLINDIEGSIVESIIS